MECRVTVSSRSVIQMVIRLFCDRLCYWIVTSIGKTTVAFFYKYISYIIKGETKLKMSLRLKPKRFSSVREMSVI